MKDKRQINEVWDAQNRKGEWHTFAYVGTGKGRMVVTLHAGAMRKSDQNLIGEVYYKNRR